MKTHILSAIVLFLITGIAANAGPIMKVPVVITKPGKYTFARNLSTSAVAKPENGAAITILASDVELDLGGFSLNANPEATMVGQGIRLEATAKQVRIHNGRVAGFGICIIALTDSEDLVLDRLELSSFNTCASLFSSTAHIQNCGFTHKGTIGVGISITGPVIGRRSTTVDRCRFVALGTGVGNTQAGIFVSGAGAPTTIRSCSFIGLSKGIEGNNETRIADNLFQSCVTIQTGCTLAGYNQ